VNIYEAGGDDLPASIYHLFGLARLYVSDARDAAIFDGDVGAKPGIARPVNDASVGDD
jgi:hypothetical protein